jgi:hypothetical protein
MDITALFDDADSAEHALVNLQAQGIFPARYKIRALHIAENSNRRGGAVFGNTAGIPGVSVGNSTGGVGFATPVSYYGDTAFGIGEGPNREVQLLVTVDGSEGHRTQSSLISNHARQVKML